MHAENTELTLNYKKYKKELQEVKLNKKFFLVTNNNRYLLLYIFIKTYRLELKVIKQWFQLKQLDNSFSFSKSQRVNSTHRKLGELRSASDHKC